MSSATAQKNHSSFLKEISELINPLPKDFGDEDQYDAFDLARTDRYEPAREDFDNRLFELSGRDPRLLSDISIVNGAYAGKATTRKNLDMHSPDSTTDSLLVDDLFSDESEEETKKMDSNEFEAEESEPEAFTGIPEIDDLESKLENLQAQEPIQLLKPSTEGDDTHTKSQHAKLELELWENFVDIRFKQQKIVSDVNRLPQVEKLELYKLSNPDISWNVNELSSEIRSLLADLLYIQSDLMMNSLPLFTGEVDNEDSDQIKSILGKRKSHDYRNVDLDECWEDIEAFENLAQYLTYSVIDKWNQRTSLTENIKPSKFKAFNDSISQQISRLMSEKERLIEKTRIYRSSKPIIGKEDTETNDRDLHLARKDPEIYDDNDFFQSILKDMIHSSSNSLNMIGNKWNAIQSIDKGQKKKFNKSKDKMLKFDVHPKLVNFVPPAPLNAQGLAVASLLFSHLFQA